MGWKPQAMTLSSLSHRVIHSYFRMTRPFRRIASLVPDRSSGPSLAVSVGGKMLSYIARASRMRRTRSSSDFETNPTISAICTSLVRHGPACLHQCNVITLHPIRRCANKKLLPPDAGMPPGGRNAAPKCGSNKTSRLWAQEERACDLTRFPGRVIRR